MLGWITSGLLAVGVMYCLAGLAFQASEMSRQGQELDELRDRLTRLEAGDDGLRGFRIQESRFRRFGRG